MKLTPACSLLHLLYEELSFIAKQGPLPYTVQRYYSYRCQNSSIYKLRHFNLVTRLAIIPAGTSNRGKAFNLSSAGQPCMSHVWLRSQSDVFPLAQLPAVVIYNPLSINSFHQHAQNFKIFPGISWVGLWDFAVHHPVIHRFELQRVGVFVCSPSC